jgi:hypothetical protein
VACLLLGRLVVGIVLSKDPQRFGVLVNHASPDAANPRPAPYGLYPFS